jgi:hypothetical protein
MSVIVGPRPRLERRNDIWRIATPPFGATPGERARSEPVLRRVLDRQAGHARAPALAPAMMRT